MSNKNKQVQIERALKRKYKSKFEPQDFRQKDTIRKVMVQWNKMNTAQKNRLPIEQLDYILDQAETNVRPQLFEEVSKIYNRKQVSKVYSKLSPQQKAQKTRQLNKIAKEEVKVLRIKEVIQKTGLRADAGNELMVKVGKEIIPNPNMLDKTVEDIIEDRKKNNNRKSPMNRKSSTEITDEAYKDWKEFQKAVKEYGGKDVQKKIRRIDQESLKDAYGLIDGYIDENGKNKGGYFKNALYTEATDEIKRYLKMMSPKQRYDIMAVLTSDKFLKIYDSDPKNTGHTSVDDYQEMMMQRQSDILKIMRNETGKIMYQDKLGRKRFKKDTNPDKSSYYTISNFI